MRSIKFRAWFEKHKRMVNHDDLDMAYEHGEGFTFAFDDSTAVHDDDDPEGTFNFKLMQYTGLKDRNDVEIYEGDIVKGELRDGFNHLSNTGVVKYGFMSYVIETIEQDYLFVYFKHGTYEVIGNIYENPELLKEE